MNSDLYFDLYLDLNLDLDLDKNNEEFNYCNKKCRFCDRISVDTTCPLINNRKAFYNNKSILKSKTGLFFRCQTIYTKILK